MERGPWERGAEMMVAGGEVMMVAGGEVMMVAGGEVELTTRTMLDDSVASEQP